jgi:hypothetical protein
MSTHFEAKLRTPREKLWILLSALWLDTELDSEWERAIAQDLLQSGFSEAELETIYRYELAPVLGKNLLSVAGVWSGFDPDWLCQEIKLRLAHRSRLGRWWIRRALPQKLWTYASEDHWRRILALRSQLIGELMVQANAQDSPSR